LIEHLCRAHGFLVLGYGDRRRFTGAGTNHQHTYKKETMKLKLKSLSTLAATLITFGSLAGGADAAITVTITDDGTNLTMTATGTYDLSQVSPQLQTNLGVNAAIAPPFGGIYGWETTYPSKAFAGLAYSGMLTGTDFKFGADIVTTTNPFYFINDLIVFSNSAPLIGSVNESATFLNTTLASLGMVSGESVTATWAGGSATIQVGAIPEPSSALLLGLGALGLAGLRSRKR
jgi:hypothetical protein